MFEKQIAYLKDNPQGLWFKAKLYGWGWTPVKWQGWAVVLGYVALLILFASMSKGAVTDREVWLGSVLPIALLTGALIGICYKKGERPHWNWGNTERK